MYYKRFKYFLAQLLGFFPLSVIINALAVMPIIAVLGLLELGESVGEYHIVVTVFTFIICWGIGFFANKLRMNIRGRWTTESEEMEVEEKLLLVDQYGGKKEITSRRYTEKVTHETRYATVATLLSFVAMPLGFVALVMSVMALFYPRIFSTPCRIREEKFSPANNRLHLLFDFVILPKRPRTGAPNLLGLLGFIELPVVLAAGILISANIAKLLVEQGFEARMDIVWLIALAELTAVFVVFIVVLIVVVDSICLTVDFSRERLLRFLIRGAVLIAVVTVAFLGVNLYFGSLGALFMDVQELIEILSLFFT